MLSRRSLAGLALFPVVPIGAVAAVPPDPIYEVIARIDEARGEWLAAVEPSAKWTAADEAISRAYDRVLATVPSTLHGIQALIGLARREGYDPEVVLDLIERVIARMLDRRP